MLILCEWRYQDIKRLQIIRYQIVLNHSGKYDSVSDAGLFDGFFIIINIVIISADQYENDIPSVFYFRECPDGNIDSLLHSKRAKHSYITYHLFICRQP